MATGLGCVSSTTQQESSYKTTTTTIFATLHWTSYFCILPVASKVMTSFSRRELMNGTTRSLFSRTELYVHSGPICPSPSPIQHEALIRLISEQALVGVQSGIQHLAGVLSTSQEIWNFTPVRKYGIPYSCSAKVWPQINLVLDWRYTTYLPFLLSILPTDALVFLWRCC